MDRIPALAMISAVAQGRLEPDLTDAALCEGTIRQPDPGADHVVQESTATSIANTDDLGRMDGVVPTTADRAEHLLDALFPDEPRDHALAARQLAGLAELWAKHDLAETLRHRADASSLAPDLDVGQHGVPDGAAHDPVEADPAAQESSSPPSGMPLLRLTELNYADSDERRAASISTAESDPV